MKALQPVFVWWNLGDTPLLSIGYLARRKKDMYLLCNSASMKDPYRPVLEERVITIHRQDIQCVTLITTL